MKDEEADELLAAVVCGEIADDDPRVLALLRAEPHRAAELAAARAAQARVRAAHADMHATLAAARRSGPTPGEQALPAAMATHLASLATPTRRRPRVFAAVAVLAAAAGLALAVFWPRHPEAGQGQQPPRYLGSEHLTPRGAVAAPAWTEFSWTIDTTSSMVFVYELTPDGHRGDLICSTPEAILGGVWRPDEQRRHLLETHPRIHWELHYTDANGPDVAVAEAWLPR